MRKKQSPKAIITAELIQAYLDKEFIGVTLSKGYDYANGKQNATCTMVVKDPKFILGKVSLRSGLKAFEVSVTASHQGGTSAIDLSCNCQKVNCVHQATFLFYLLKQKGVKPQIIRDYALSDNNTNSFRKIPYNSEQLELILDRFHDASGDNYGEEVIGFFESPQDLIIEITERSGWYHQEKSQVALRSGEAGVEIKCLKCNAKTNKFCDHQAKALSGLLEELPELLDDWENIFQVLLKDSAKSAKVSTTNFLKYFQIGFDQDSVGYIKISDNIVDARWLEKKKELLSYDKVDRKREGEKLEEYLLSGNEKMSAYKWGMEGSESFDNQLALGFLRGVKLKTRKGIKGNQRKISQHPIGFPSGQIHLAQQILLLSNEPDREQLFSEMNELIEENLAQLNEAFHYVYYPKNSRQQATTSSLVSFYPERLELELRVKAEDEMVKIERIATLDGEKFDLNKVVFYNDIFCATTEYIYRFASFGLSKVFPVFDDFQGDEIILSQVEAVDIQPFLVELKNYFPVIIESAELKTKEIMLSEAQYQIALREVGSFITFEPRLKFSDFTFNIFNEELRFFENGVQYTIATDLRDFLLDFIRQAHPSFNNKIQVQDYVYLDLPAMMNNYWFLRFVEACAANEIELLGQKELSRFNYSKHRAKTYSHLKSGIDWFEVDMGVSFGKETVKAADWIRALRNNETFVVLKDGSLGMLPEEWLAQARKVLAVADIEKGDIKISKYRFNIIDDLFEELDDKKIIKELAEKKKRLAEYDTNKKYKLPETVTADLRPYQKHGFAWLKFLDESGFGGILADDMGLGKTLQVISLLADQKNKNSSMVIVPRSLLFNWAAELDKFCPSLTYVIHHGPNRGKDLEALTKRDLIISTYDTTAADIGLFQNYRFNYIVLDESQAIKNPDSKRYKAMRLLQSDNKIAMTGTPIENNTFDLYAQLSFTSPGLLGSKTSFRNNFAIPIDNDGNQEAANLLRKLIHPFILRRTKEQVASDLPDKTETVLYCEMAPAQRKLYDKLKQQIKLDLEEEVEEKGLAKSKFKILDGLLRLRQMCNSPLLVNPAFTGKNAESVKIKVLLQNLTEELDQHNALVFSQFTSLLAIVRAELDKREIPYAYLDGSTRKRQEAVEKFMENSEVKIFLISIKAGNTGLNLTKADYVYILDPWWNPAVEAQAIDRTHRIGQDKQVFAYKLICKDSIEEKILKLQEKKKKLAQDLIRTDENILKSLDKDTLMSLFD